MSASPTAASRVPSGTGDDGEGSSSTDARVVVLGADASEDLEAGWSDVDTDDDELVGLVDVDDDEEEGEHWKGPEVRLMSSHPLLQDDYTGSMM